MTSLGENRKIKKGRDNIYVNAVIQPTFANIIAGKPVPCEFNENLTISVVDTPEDFYCSIVRWELPTDNIPILVFPLDTTQTDPLVGYPQIGINVGGEFPTPSGVAQSIGGTNFLEPVRYIPENSYPQPRTVGPFTNIDATNIFYFIFSIKAFINMINNALNTAMIAAGFPLLFTLTLTAPASVTAGSIYTTALGDAYTVQTTTVSSTTLVLNDTFNSGALKPPTNGTLTFSSGTGPASLNYTSFTTTGVTRPFYTFGTTTNVITIHITDDFFAAGLKVTMNQAMVNYLDSFNLYYDAVTTLSTHDFISIEPQLVSPYLITEDYVTISLWFSLRKILIVSNTLPIVSEVVPLANSSGNVNYQAIITDFSVALDFASQLSEVLVYNPTAQYRLVTMTGRSPLNKIDFKFFWEDRFGNTYPVFLNPWQQASVKLGIFSKSLYNKDPDEWRGSDVVTWKR